MAAEAARGLQWPRDASGRRSSVAPSRRIVAAALRPIDAPGAAAVEAESRWRQRYPQHWLRLVRAQAQHPARIVASAEAGLAAAAAEFVFLRGGSELSLAAAMAAPQGAPLGTLTLRGEGPAEPARWQVPYRGEWLEGDALARQIDRWQQAGVAEAGHCDALRRALAHPEWFDLGDRTFALLGAGSEAGPLSWLARWRATLVAVDLPNPDTWRRIGTLVRAGNATLLAPRVRGSADDLAASGADLLEHTPELAHWLGAQGRALDIGALAYADGERHVRVTMAMDAIAIHLLAAQPRSTLGLMATPTDVFAVPEALALAVQQRYASRGWPQRLAQAGLRGASGGRSFAPHIEALFEAHDGSRWGLVDALVTEQGPNYALAKRLQQWRALAARAEGRRVALNVAPSTATASVMHNPLLAAGFRGAAAFDVEVFAPETTNALMAALWVHDLRHELPAAAHAHPLTALATGANHGGLWRIPYRPRSVLPMAALLGWVTRPRAPGA